MLITGCAVNAPNENTDYVRGKTICDSYIVLSMCVEDVTGDDTADIVYFTDTQEVFMYQEGRRDAMPQSMTFHRCAVPLDEGMQATTNRILHRDSLSFSEELDITRRLIANYTAAKPTIDACNEKFDAAEATDTVQDGEFSDFEQEWDDG